MGDLTPFSYRPGHSVLFKLDVRCKVICTALLSIMMTIADFSHLSLLTLLLSWALYHSGVTIRIFIRDLKYFLFILFLIFIVRAVVTPGTHLPILKLMGVDLPEMVKMEIFSDIYVTEEGVIDGCRVAWRFLMIMVLGILFSCSTQASALRGAVIWFLKPVPFIPEKRVGVMVSLFVRFLPLILEKVHEVSDSQKARCANLQKNPLKRARNITVPILKKVFQSADTLAIAMASRCYHEERVEHYFSRSGYEGSFYSATLALAAFILFYRSPLFLH